MPGITPSQTVGPFFAFGLMPKDYDWSEVIGSDLVTADVSGERIRVEGRVLDGDGRPINDALVEIWQADAAGRYAHPADRRPLPNTRFTGFGRCGTEQDGCYGFHTIRPGAVAGPNGSMQAPHIALALFARGMLRHVFTRIYFAGDERNGSDPILALVPTDRRETLIAQRADRDGRPTYRLDIRVQGDRETVFFDI